MPLLWLQGPQWSKACVSVLSCFSRVRLSVTLWTIACQASLSMEFSRQEYWSGWSCPTPGYLYHRGIEPESSALLGGFFTTSTTWEALVKGIYLSNNGNNHCLFISDGVQAMCTLLVGCHLPPYYIPSVKLQMRHNKLFLKLLSRLVTALFLKHVFVLNRFSFFVTPWTVACQAPLSMGFPSQEHWSGLPFPSPRDLLDPGIELGSPALQANCLPAEPPGKPTLI